VFQFIVLPAISIAVYEVFFNLSLWSALMASNNPRGRLNPEILINPYPNPKIPSNLVFAMKTYTAAMVIGLYSLHYQQKV